jgi:hypothetical protein
MEEAPENGKESSNSAHANGMNDLFSSNCRKFGVIKVTTFSVSFAQNSRKVA